MSLGAIVEWAGTISVALGLVPLLGPASIARGDLAATGRADGFPASTPTRHEPCGKEVVIADGERGSNETNLGGFFYVFADEKTRLEPKPGSATGFTMTKGGANSSKYAARIHGRLASSGVPFAGVGLNFTDPKDAYDASGYAGVAFYVRRGEKSTARLRVKLPSADTDPDGQVCSECYNDFGTWISLETQWTRVVMPFASLRQEPGWGTPRPAKLDATKVYALIFQVDGSDPNASRDFDIWIDDVHFLRCSD